MGVQLSRVATFKEEFKGSNPSCLAWHPDSDAVAFGTSADAVYGGFVLVFSIATKALLYRLQIKSGGVVAVAWSPNKKLLAVVTGQSTPDSPAHVRLYDAAADQFELNAESPHSGKHINALSWAPNSQWFATVGSDENIKIWDASTNAVVREIKTTNPPGMKDVKWSPDGTLIAVVAGHGVTLWDAQSGKRHAWITLMRSVAWSPDSKSVAAGATPIDECGTAYIYSGGNFTKMAKQLKGHPICVDNIDWSADGKYIVGGSGAGPRKITVWEAASGNPIGTSGDNQSHEDMDLAFSPNSQFIATLFRGKPEEREAVIWKAPS